MSFFFRTKWSVLLKYDNFKGKDFLSQRKFEENISYFCSIYALYGLLNLNYILFWSFVKTWRYVNSKYSNNRLEYNFFYEIKPSSFDSNFNTFKLFSIFFLISNNTNPSNIFRYVWSSTGINPKSTQRKSQQPAKQFAFYACQNHVMFRNSANSPRLPRLECRAVSKRNRNEILIRNKNASRLTNISILR